jgi:hypothetical protein
MKGERFGYVIVQMRHDIKRQTKVVAGRSHCYIQLDGDFQAVHP